MLGLRALERGHVSNMDRDRCDVTRRRAVGGFGGIVTTDAGACQQANYTFEPKIPTVYLLVDRSGSMFHCLTGDTGSAVCAISRETRS